MKTPGEAVAVSAFDALARDYDAEFTDSLVGKTLRALVWSRLDALFAASQRILELGCGTGEDAVHLAQRGVRIVATDVSREMTGVALRKAAAARCEDKIEVRAQSMEEVSEALRGETFDGVFSNFGAVNCVGNLASLAAGLATLVRPGAPLLWVVMGRDVPWEWLWYSLHGQWSKSLRRYRREGVEWRGLRINYPRPREATEALSPWFTVTRLAPLGCFLPPSYAAAWLSRSPRIFTALVGMERRAQTRAWLARCSDHYILEATRR